MSHSNHKIINEFSLPSEVIVLIFLKIVLSIPDISDLGNDCSSNVQLKKIREKANYEQLAVLVLD